MASDPRTRAIVCLTGFMGTGKSTVARLLARQIGWQHVELDKRFVEFPNQTIPEIFAKQGEAEFRQIERDQLARILGEAAEQQKPRLGWLGGGTTAQPCVTSAGQRRFDLATLSGRRSAETHCAHSGSPAVSRRSHLP